MPGAPIVRTVVIANRRGLHARAAAKFVKCAAQYAMADITVFKDGQSVSGQSIMGLMMLAAPIGSSITISAKGAEAAPAVAALVDLVERKFDEGE